MARPKNLRRGLRPLGCICGAKVYATWAQVERHGLPVCACGERFMPEDLELAGALNVDAPVLREYHARVEAFLRGQHSHASRRHQLRPAEQVVAAEIEQARAESARAARLNALRPVAEPIPF